MNKEAIKGMVMTIGAVVVGVLIADVVRTKMAKKGAVTTAG